MLLLSGWLGGSAQQSAGKLFFEHLTTEDGLSHNYIQAIFQDQDGFIWLGSDNGLNRYDGQRIDVLSTNTLPALGGNKVRRIAQDGDKNLWILHENGLDKMAHATQQVKTFFYDKERKTRFVGMEMDGQQRLLVCTEKEIFRYDASGDTIALLQSAPSDYRYSALVCCGGKYYLGTRQHGLVVYDEQWKLLEHIYPRSIQQGPLTDGVISILRADSQGCLWSVIVGICINKYNPQTGEVKSYRLSSTSVINKEIRTIIELDEEYMLIGTFNGLFRLRKEDMDRVIVEKGEIGAPGCLSHYSVYSLYKDRQGILWVGTFAGGVNYSHRYSQRFRFFAPPHLAGRVRMGKEDAEKNIWFATEGNGLLCHHPEAGLSDNFWLNENRHYNDNIIKSIAVSGDSILCGNQRGELYLYSIRKKTFSLVRKYDNTNILCIFKDSHQHWWVSVQDQGVFRLDSDSVQFPFSNVIGEIEPGLLLLLTQKEGIYLYNLRTQQKKHLPMNNLGIPDEQSLNMNSFYRDAEHNLWLTTERHGLLLIDEQGKLKKQYLSHAGFSTDRLYFVTGQQAGKLWIIGGHKLYLFDPAQNQLHAFDKNNGLPLTDMDASGLMDSQHRFWIPGNIGYVMVDSRNFELNTIPASVVLTTLRINNRLQQPGGENSVLGRCLADTPELVLKHNQTNISIAYSSDNHIYGSSDRFFYKMNGIDPDWVDAGSRREVFYSNLPPGDYVLRIKACNNDGSIGPETQLKIEVLPPLWARWWAYVLYAAVVFLILQRYMAYKQRKQKLEQELYLKQVEKDKSEEFNRELQTFFTQVAHEFRTPLTLILNPLDEIQKKMVHVSGVKEDLHLIRRNAKRLLTLVNDLMDLRKIENGNGELELSSFNFNDFIQETYYSFQATARQREINLQLQLPDELVLATFDKDALEKVFFNLLSNALKFTPAGGTVVLTVSLMPGESPFIRTEVKDTGVGISNEDINKIFKPFAFSHQDLHGQIGGSGVGLSIARAIVEKHQGTISVGRMEPHGTCFSIDLPWTYDKRYEVASQLVVDGEEEAEVEVASFKVASISETVLLVDDNIEILTYLQKGLSGVFRIVTAQNGREALELLGKESVSLVVSDVMMPEMDGMELCTRIKESPLLCHLPVILLTAKSMSVYVEEGFQAGADDYLVKPFKTSTLIVRIHNILSGRKKLKEIYGKQLSLKSAGIELEPADQSFADQYEAVVKKHLSNPEFDVEILCREMGLSRATLYRKVKAITNLSPAELIRNIRLECAVEMLRTSQQTATEIAYQTGFGSYNHFADYFKSVYGVSPKAYKDKFKVS